MQPESSPAKDIHSDSFLHELMRRQLQLSVWCAAAFLVVLLGLPLLSYFADDFMSQRVAGFTLNWFVLGVLFFPFVWGIAFVFIRKSMALEAAEVEEVRQSQASSQTPGTSRSPSDS